MDRVYTDLAAKIVSLARSRYPNRILVGVAGPPGSGKSTVVDNVVASINPATGGDEKLAAIGVSLDGFHYTIAQLDAFPDPVEAHERRGAPWTFDVKAIVKFVQILQASKVPLKERSTILAPSFDHALKDPVEDDIIIPAEADIVILDGNYILLNDEGWRDISKALDFRVFIDIDPEVARARVAQRHVVAGIERNLVMGEKRFDGNDGPNGELIRSKLSAYDYLVESKAAY